MPGVWCWIRPLSLCLLLLLCAVAAAASAAASAPAAADPDDDAADDAADADADTDADDGGAVGRTNAGLIKEAIASIARGDRVAIEGGAQKLDLKVIGGRVSLIVGELIVSSMRRKGAELTRVGLLFLRVYVSNWSKRFKKCGGWLFCGLVLQVLGGHVSSKSGQARYPCCVLSACAAWPAASVCVLALSRNTHRSSGNSFAQLQ